MAKKEKYRLGALLKLKESALKKAEVALSRALKELKDEKDKKDRLVKQKEELIQKREKARRDMRQKIAGGSSSIKDSQYHLGFIDKLKEDEEKLVKEIKEQDEVIELAEAKLKRARRDYMDAASELNTMEKHRELWLKKQAQALSAQENKQMNEIGNTIFGINRGKVA